MPRVFAVLLLGLGTLMGTPVCAQPQVVIDQCSTTTPSPVFGADGTDVWSDTITVTATEVIEDTRVLVQVTHTFVGDLIIELTSPDLQVVRLHDEGGGSDDDLDATFDDAGVFNGAPYACGCAMQPSGPGMLADFSGTASSGPWTLDLTDSFPSSGGGTLDNWCLQILNDPPDPFIRGDVDGDGTFNGLADGVFALSYQFVQGSAAPPCMKAADADDNGVFNGIIDAAVILNFQFVPASPAPPAPHPLCGNDPTPEIPALGCETPLACP